MYQTQVQFIIAMLMLADAGIVVVSVWLAGISCALLGNPLPPIPGESLVGMTLFMVLVCSFLMLKADLYSERRPKSITLSILRIAVVTSLSMATLGTTFYLLNYSTIPNLYLFSFSFFLILLLSANRVLLDLILSRLLKTRFHSRRALIVGWDQRADILAKTLTHQRSWGHRLLGFLADRPGTNSVIYGLPRLGSLDDLDKVLTTQVVDDVFFALPDCSIPLRMHLETCEQHGVSYHIMPALYDPGSCHKIQVETIQGVPMLSKTMVHINPSGYIYKRILDYVGGAVGLILLAAIYPFVALAIRLDSPGPVFFTQTRVGRHGRLFTMYKFRTMYQDAEARKEQLLRENQMIGALFKMNNDPRVTRVGCFLRRSSLDEFPQFLNVLLGEMSLVGPRPPTPDEVARYQSHHHRRLSIRPGITGLWQTSGRNTLPSFEQALELDLAYIDQWRFWKDVHILLRTVLVVLRREGAV